ncbi:MAG TPA: hypothetical protein PK129_02165 [Cellvibrionaceae bacterium]|nr:hypothetical protein [Cellvibrionaceae bacterium]
MPREISLSVESEKLKIVICELNDESNIGALKKLVVSLDAVSIFTKTILLLTAVSVPISLYFLCMGS